MDPVTLVAVAATALITAVTTDSWQAAQTAIVKLWRRVHPSHAETIRDELAEVRQEVIKAHKQGDTDIEQGLEADWRRKLGRLVATDPTIIEELQQVLDTVLTPLANTADINKTSQIIMNAQAGGGARVYQAGRDIHVNKR